MESEGPYSTGDSDCLVFLNCQAVENFDSRRDAMNAASLANTAYAAGRMAERERFYKDMGYSKDEISYAESDTQWKSGHGKAVDGVIKKLRGGQDAK